MEWTESALSQVLSAKSQQNSKYSMLKEPTATKIELLNSSTSIHKYLTASYPGPAQLSIASSMVKWERTWYIFSREWCWDRKDGRKGLIVRGCTGPRAAEEPRYQVTYHTYLANGRWLSYTLSVEGVVTWTIHKMQPVSSANFRHLPITSSHVRKDTRLSPLYRIGSDTKLDGAWVRG